MTAPAGPCEWCGGPQNWTVASGVMYVRCINGCQSLFTGERVDLLPSSERSLPYLEGRDEVGTFGGEEGVPRKGADAGTTISKDDDLPF